MTENQRESFRVGPEAHLEAELFHEGRVVPCSVENLSAGGAKLVSSLEMPVGAQCTLGVRLGAELRKERAQEYVSFLMEVLEATPLADGSIDYRMRSMTAPGSREYEAAAKLVFAAQRRTRSRETGAGVASPMVTDSERRRRFWPVRRPRFGKGALRPGSED